MGEEFSVGGKKVVLKDYLPSSKALGIFRGIERARDLGSLSVKDQVEDLIPAVESWEFDGDPAKLKSWENLDAISLGVLVLEIAGRLDRRLANTLEQAKK
jgi:hypothetical protein